MEDIFYKVLWVEDDQSIVQGYQIRAEEKNLDLEVATNWEEAKEKLLINFNEYSAIILDAQCRIKKSSGAPSHLFLGEVSDSLSRICGEKRKYIPWYVLSAGTMEKFDVILELINNEERQSFNEQWGPLLYNKTDKRIVYGREMDDVDVLFDNINRVASNIGINTVLFRHADVFKYLGEGKIIEHPQAKRYILKMLSALYYPEENINFEYEGNPLRKVIEYLFRSANKYGLLPDVCFDTKGGVNLTNSSKFMAGLDADAYEGTNKYQIRYGVAGKDSIFDKEISNFVKGILDFSNSNSHTTDNEPYIIEDDKKEMFFAYLLQLCHVIKWFGRYVESHSDVEYNKSLFRKIETDNTIDNKSQYEGKVFLPEKDDEGYWHCGECWVVIPYGQSGTMMKLRNISPNTNPKTKSKYPYFAKYDKVNA